MYYVQKFRRFALYICIHLYQLSCDCLMIASQFQCSDCYGWFFVSRSTHCAHPQRNCSNVNGEIMIFLRNEKPINLRHS